MYILPTDYKCEKCGCEYEYSPHQPHPSPTINTGVEEFVTCPMCWLEFLKENIPMMKPKE